MSMPEDTAFLRHGDSEGNAAKRLSEKGDHSAIKRLKGRHTASFRLTKRGREQAARAGKWLREEFYKDGRGFDRFMTSEYVRAMETSALLELPNAEWICETYLSERDWGDLDVLPEDERQERFGEALKLRKKEPFFWRPHNGESFKQLSMYVDRMFDKLHREYSQRRVLVTCHGEFMLAAMVRMEHMSQTRFKELYLSKRDEDRIFNCQVLHYTRRNPATGVLTPHADWYRMIRPTEDPVKVGEWQEVRRPRYSNQGLLDIVSQVEPMVA